MSEYKITFISHDSYGVLTISVRGKRYIYLGVTEDNYTDMKRMSRQGRDGEVMNWLRRYARPELKEIMEKM